MEKNAWADLYINRDVEPVVDHDWPYTRWSMHKRSHIRPFNNIGGWRPYEIDEQNYTSAKDFNKHITDFNADEQTQRDFYLGIQRKNKKEIEYLWQQNKTDHIKKIDLALNFKAKPTTYTETHDFTEKKKYETDHPDDLHHYKKSFMKTYEECKHKYKSIMCEEKASGKGKKFHM